MTTKCVLIVCSVIAAIAIYSPSRHASHYDYIDLKNVYSELSFSHIIKTIKPNLKNCDYKNVILNNTDVEIATVTEARVFYKLVKGGEYFPKSCNPLLKVAVIVPYRNRSQQLEIFLSYMHNFLQNQYLFYRIFIVNQTDNLPFNRAKMLNYGAKVAIDMGFPCLILHDVDLIPLNTGNIYGCSKRPRHMSSSLDTFRFNLPYSSLFGGAVAILSEQFQAVNGLSNQFIGWGGEDDDFYRRLETYKILPYRFTPLLSRYTMLFHKKEKANPDRYDILERTASSHKMDGLSTLPSDYTIKYENLYTLVNAS